MEPTQEKRIQTSAGMETATETVNRINQARTEVPVTVLEQPPKDLAVPQVEVDPALTKSAVATAQNFATSADQAAAAQAEAEKTQTSGVRDLMDFVSGRGAERVTTLAEADIPESQKQLADLTSKIKLRSEQLAQYADQTFLGEEVMRSDAAGRDITSSAFSAKARERRLQRAIEQTGKAASLRTDIATAELMQNNITAATAQIDAALEAKYSPVEEALKNEMFFLQRQWQLSDKTDQRAWEARMNVVEAQQDEIKDAKRLTEMMVQAGASPEEVKSVMSKGTPGEQRSSALSVLGRITSEDRRMDLAIKAEQLKELRKPKEATRSTQIIEQNGNKMLIDSQTGEIISTFGADVPEDAIVKEKSTNFVNSIDTLKDHPGLNSSVGPTWYTRTALADAFGAKDEFVGSVENVVRNLTLNTFAEAKEKGMTFGAMSQGEWDILSESATKIAQWRKIKDGSVVSYDVSESAFKKELDVLSNFAKMDAIRNGASPSDIGVQVMEDGTMWTQNSDGSYTQIQ